jgi:DNA-binding PadR family transcriptional regulator
MHDRTHRRGGHRDRTDDEGHESFVREFLNDLRRGGRSAVRRGDVRPAILAVLEDEPMHGYQVIRVLEERSRGRWRPSAGSVYPTLQQLQDEGLVRSEEVDGRRTYSLTDEGRTHVATFHTGHSPLVIVKVGEADESPDVRREAMQLVRAALQVSKVGSVTAQQEARRTLIEARRELYRLLANDEPAEGDA